MASGVLNAARQVGGLLGVAVFGYLVRDTAAQAFQDGMNAAMVLATTLLLLASGLCLLVMPSYSKAGMPGR